MVLAAFVFPLDAVAALMAFWARDTLAATVLGLFSTSWLTIGVSLITGAPVRGTAMVLEDLRQRAVLPVFRRGSSTRAMYGDYGEQLTMVVGEAGVRRPL